MINRLKKRNHKKCVNQKYSNTESTAINIRKEQTLKETGRTVALSTKLKYLSHHHFSWVINSGTGSGHVSGQDDAILNETSIENITAIAIATAKNGFTYKL